MSDTTKTAESSAPDDWPLLDGREVRGGLRGGHQHMAFVSLAHAVEGCPACDQWVQDWQAAGESAGEKWERGSYGH